jgi:HEPN domain-containing protein
LGRVGKEGFEICDRCIFRDKETAYGLFFVHLALEKAIKAHVVKETKEIPPKIHNLNSLAKLGNIQFSQVQSDFCGKMNFYNIEGRYHDTFLPQPPLDDAKEYYKQAEELISWLIKQL